MASGRFRPCREWASRWTKPPIVSSRITWLKVDTAKCSAVAAIGPSRLRAATPTRTAWAVAAIFFASHGLPQSEMSGCAMLTARFRNNSSNSGRSTRRSPVAIGTASRAPKRPSVRASNRKRGDQASKSPRNSSLSSDENSPSAERSSTKSRRMSSLQSGEGVDATPKDLTAAEYNFRRLPAWLFVMAMPTAAQDDPTPELDGLALTKSQNGRKNCVLHGRLSSTQGTAILAQYSPTESAANIRDAEYA